MKKFVLLIVSAVLACGLTGCIHTGGNCDCNTEIKSISIPLQVRSSEWQWCQEGCYFNCVFTIDELTEEVFKNGTVTCARVYNKGELNQYQLSLPQTLHKMEPLEDGTTAYYTQTIDFSYGEGFVEIVLTNSDFFYNVRPESMDFWLRMVW